MQHRKVIKFGNLIKAFNGIDHFKEFFFFFSGYWDSLTKDSQLDYYCLFPVQGHLSRTLFSVQDGTNVQFLMEMRSRVLVFSSRLLATSSGFGFFYFYFYFLLKLLADLDQTFILKKCSFIKRKSSNSSQFSLNSFSEYIQLCALSERSCSNLLGLILQCRTPPRFQQYVATGK